MLRRASAGAEAVAFSVPDTKYGERVAAAVVLGGEVSSEDSGTTSRVAGRLQGSRCHLPVAEIPRTPTGKVQRSRMASHLQLGDR